MNRYVAFGLFIVLFFLVWNLCDYLFTALITRSGYQFAAVTDLAVPLVVAVALGYLFFLRNKKD